MPLQALEERLSTIQASMEALQLRKALLDKQQGEWAGCCIVELQGGRQLMTHKIAIDNA